MHLKIFLPSKSKIDGSEKHTLRTEQQRGIHRMLSAFWRRQMNIRMFTPIDTGDSSDELIAIFQPIVDI